MNATFVVLKQINCQEKTVVSYDKNTTERDYTHELLT